MRPDLEPSYRRLRIALLVLLAAALPLSLNAQVRAGFEGAYQFGLPLELVRGAGTVNGLFAPGLGSSSSNTWRAGIVGSFAGLFGASLGLDVSVGYTTSNGTFQSATQDSDRVFDPLTQTVVVRRYRIDIATTSSSLDLTAQLRHHATDHLDWGLSLWAARRLTTGFGATRHDFGPFPLGVTAHDTALALPDATGSGVLRAGTGLLVLYEIPLGGHVLLRPEISASLDVVAVGDVGVRRATTVRAGVGLLYDFTDSGDSLAGPDDSLRIAARDSLAARARDSIRADSLRLVAARDDSLRSLTRADSLRAATLRADSLRAEARRSDSLRAARAPMLAATIDLFSIGRGGAVEQSATVTAELVEHALHMPMPAVLLFARGTSELPDYTRRMSADEAMRFTLDSLAPARPEDAALHLLDIVASRMRADALASLTLIGSCARSEPAELAHARAEAVLAYLRDVCGIAASRLTLGPDQTGDGDGACAVRITSGSTTITEPIDFAWRAWRYDMPTLDMRPAIRSAAGVAHWEIRVLHGDRVITAYGSGDAGHGSEITLALPEVRSQAAPQPLVAELSVTDSAGQSMTARDTLMIRLAPRAATDPERASRTIDQYVVPSSAARADWHSTAALLPVLRSRDRVAIDGPDAPALLRRMRAGAPRSVTWRTTRDAAVTNIASPQSKLILAATTAVVERGGR